MKELSESPDHGGRRVAILFWAIALTLGFIQAWANRFYMGNDGVPYLDMADAYLCGDWHTALNGYWNPLYAWLIGLDFLILRPSAYWEFPSIQLINFCCYVFTVGSFEFLVRALLLARKPANATGFRLIAYGIFLWTALVLIRVHTCNADMLVAASLFLSSGILIRAQSRNLAGVLQPVLLGATLAAGYYCKAVMFPVGILFLLLACFALGWRRSLTAFSVFVVLSAPLIAGISKIEGRFSYGDTGTLNYAWYVDGVPFRWWQGGPDGAGQPEHPPRVALDSPRIYEFGGDMPRNITYPIWYDSTYWYKGLHAQFLPRRFAKALRANLKGLVVFLLQSGGFLLGLGFCWLRTKKKQEIRTNFARIWLPAVVSMAGILLYCAVHVETRHVAAFVAIVLVGAYAVLEIPETGLAATIAIGGLAWSLGSCAVTASLGSQKLSFEGMLYVPWGHTSTNVPWEAAKGLEKLGVRAGDKVSSVCPSNRSNVYWARLARVQIVAEPDFTMNFWQLGDVDQSRVLAALARSGASIAVADQPPPDPAREVGWQQVGTTTYYVRRLPHM